MVSLAGSGRWRVTLVIGVFLVRSLFLLDTTAGASKIQHPGRLPLNSEKNVGRWTGMQPTWGHSTDCHRNRLADRWWRDNSIPQSDDFASHRPVCTCPRHDRT